MSLDNAAYQERLDYLYGRLNYERLGMPRTSAELRLGRMRRLLRALGDPQHALTIVHVAGTKGKGSTSALIASALSASGRRTGLFTSPHLTRLEERFRVDGQDISAQALVELTDQVRPVVARLDQEDPHFADRGATFFEITTAMGLLHFASAGANAVVLEVGLGGRLDSTNAVHPAVSIITSISFDHTRLLGATLGAIAREKAGILKRGRPAVIGVTDEEPLAEIRRIGQTRHCPMRELGRDFSFEFFPPRPPLSRPSAGGFQARTWRTDWGVLPVPMLGRHQALNASVALAALDVLAEQGIETSRNAVEQGFASVSWPARMELMGEAPWLVVDGAHNVASAQALVETLQTNFPRCHRTLIFGTTKEKDQVGQLRVLLPAFDTVVATRYLENPRAVPLDELAQAINQVDPACEPLPAADPAEALAIARSVTPRDGLICVAGSLFLAGETRNLILNPSLAAARPLSSPR
jgi:dihydrofolate synthase/folylpolyglutamate synthase